MKYLHQMLLILLFSFLGELLHYLIPAPIPASIYGMALLFGALALKIIKPEQVKDGGNFLVTFLPVLFVAPIVSLLDFWELISPNLLGIAAVIIFSTLICFAVSGLITQWMVKKQEGKKHD